MKFNAYLKINFHSSFYLFEYFCHTGCISPNVFLLCIATLCWVLIWKPVLNTPLKSRSKKNEWKN